MHLFSCLFAPLPYTIEMPTKQKPCVNQSVLEALEGSDAVCIIPRESLELLLNNNTSLQQQTLELQKQTVQLNTNVVNNLNRLADIMDSMTTHATTSTTSLDAKLDKLIAAVSSNNVKATAVADIDHLLNNRKAIIEKRVRNEKLGDYYQELLTHDPPFVRREFRTHVSRTSTESVLDIRRKQSIATVEVEISVLREQLSTCVDKQQKLDESIQKYFQHIDEDETKRITDKMKEQEQKIADKFVKTKLEFLKKFDTDEKGQITDYLLKFSEDKQQKRSKRYWGRNRRPPRNWSSTSAAPR
jgi:hypothetical protein